MEQEVGQEEITSFLSSQGTHEQEVEDKVGME
jgi:hypothetical protein